MIRLLIVSDLHAAANQLERDDAVSWLSTLSEYNTPKRNPLVTIPSLLNKECLEVDWLICPGDLADCGDPEAQAAVWQQLESLRQAVGAKGLLATAGNHDIDSRGKHSNFDPKGALQRLNPPFPGLSEQLCDFYWSRNYALFEDGETRFVILNSSAFHGVHSGDPQRTAREYLHGRVSDRTIESIINQLGSARRRLNILLVHHHIYRNDHITSADYSEMANGAKLIRTLIAADVGPWFIVHGHQHYPDLFNASGDAQAPVVLSSASASRRLTGSLIHRALNQIHHVSLDFEAVSFVEAEPCGVIKSWYWIDQAGWRHPPLPPAEASPGEITNIPYVAGFGCRRGADAWASLIAAELHQSGVTHLEWVEVLNILPRLKFVMPSVLRKILDRLRDSHSVTCHKDEYGFPVQIGMKR